MQGRKENGVTLSPKLFCHLLFIAAEKRLPFAMRKNVPLRFSQIQMKWDDIKPYILQGKQVETEALFHLCLLHLTLSITAAAWPVNLTWCNIGS